MGDMQALFQLANMYYDGVGTLPNLVCHHFFLTCYKFCGGIENLTIAYPRPSRHYAMLRFSWF